MKWIKASKDGLPLIEVVTIDQLIEYGRLNGANIVNGMPWSFKYKNHPVSHENNCRYLVGCPSVDCTKDNPIIFFCDKVFNYWKNPGRLNIRYKGRPDVLITGEGNWCFWSGRAAGLANVDDYRGAHIRVKDEDLKYIEWLDEKEEPAALQGDNYWQKRCEAAEVILMKYSNRIPDCPEYMDWQTAIAALSATKGEEHGELWEEVYDLADEFGKDVDIYQYGLPSDKGSLIEMWESKYTIHKK